MAANPWVNIWQIASAFFVYCLSMQAESVFRFNRLDNVHAYLFLYNVFLNENVNVRKVK